ncbi:hypothetical protein TFLX_01283 [Thermoflexales bacterium]|nr:hypothetical protein TFLX_01283 [Thermoflexales bacterium]
MPFTAVLAVFALMALATIFGLTYKSKGLKSAFITTGIAFIISAVWYVATIQVLVSAMD